MATKKQIITTPLSGHPTLTKIYMLQILETNPDVLLVHKEITEGEFELLNSRGHLKEFFPIDYSKIPKGALPEVHYYEIL